MKKVCNQKAPKIAQSGLSGSNAEEVLKLQKNKIFSRKIGFEWKWRRSRSDFKCWKRMK